MINFEIARKVFDEYVNNYDLNNKDINLKYYHSLRVADISENIAISLNLPEEDILLAKIIGLLHDIGRFEQVSDFDSFNDRKTVDHGYMGCFTLFNNNFIREFINDNQNDNIIEKAIFSHNKISIPDEYNTREQLFSKILKDADKIDIFYITPSYYSLDIITKENYTEEIIDSLMNHMLIDKKSIHTELDNILLNLGLVYDINYKYSFNVLKEKKYLDIIFDGLSTKDDNRKKLYNDIKMELNNYIDRKVGENDVR